jgi:AcrR family transcriptional regulator
MQRESPAKEERLRRRLAISALETTGEVGHRRLTVQQILDRTGTSRVSFYSFFTNKGDCYAAGYSLASERLSADLLQATAAVGGWQSGFHLALHRVAEFLLAEPQLARGLLAEVHVAGGAALAKRDEVFERLSHAVDAARRETTSPHSPPPISATFILSAIEEAVVSSLLRGRPDQFAAAVPELAYLGVSVYFGEKEARRQLKISPGRRQGPEP